jgi:hypothetical protein
MNLTYKTPEGDQFPLKEALTPFSILLYRKDRRMAIIGDPEHCLVALGACRHRNVYKAFIGSGRDAYIVMRTAEGHVAFHYVIPAAAARARDEFETNRKMVKREITLEPPTAKRTIAARRRLDKRRRAEIAAGSPVKKRGTPKKTRIMRLGVPHRPAAQIKQNVVTVPDKVLTV